MNKQPCRCGHSGADPHPCHGEAYTCRKPATFRVYAPRVVSLTGVQMKCEVSGTYACDACWAAFAEQARKAGVEVQA